MKDIFQACMMFEVEYLIVAVRNTYRGHKDFEIVYAFLETLYISSRLHLPLKGILLVGYYKVSVINCKKQNSLEMFVMS